MNYVIHEAPRRQTGGAQVSSELVTDWASRVSALWVESRARRPDDTRAAGDLARACLVRDELNNRLTQPYPDEFTCAEESLQTLRDADAFFLQFTVESTTAESLSRHNHYARRSEWWWRRQPRLLAA